jgi:hypothetical protein
MKNKLAMNSLKSLKKAFVIEDKVSLIKEQINLSSKKNLLSNKREKYNEDHSVTRFNNNIQTIPLGENCNETVLPINNNFYYTKKPKTLTNSSSEKNPNRSSNLNSISNNTLN